MKKKQQGTAKKRTVKFTHVDGHLIKNRQIADDNWEFYSRWKDFLENTLARECREKGVKLISYKITDDGIEAIVAWL